MKLFISYARVDKPLCKQIVHRLEDIHDVWYDKRLHAGQEWWLEIQERLDWCEGFIYLLSPESVVSEYCQKEFAIATEAGKHIFPVLIQARTQIPENLSHVHYADLSEGMEDIITLMNALTIAERRQRSQPLPAPKSAPVQNPQQPPKDVSPNASLAQAADAIEANNFDSAVFILNQALTKKPAGRIGRILEAMLSDAESALEQQAALREAAREYAPILELVRREATQVLGCQEFVVFRQEFPDYDPDNVAAICADHLPQVAPPPSGSVAQAARAQPPSNKMKRFTQRARRVLSLSQEEAERMRHSSIAPEHVLMGLMREEGGVAGRVLRDVGLEVTRLEELIHRLSGTAPAQSSPLDLSPATKNMLDLAVDEAERMGHHYIGTEHLLLALVRQKEGVAIEALRRLGVSPEEIRRQTRRVIQESPIQQPRSDE